MKKGDTFTIAGWNRLIPNPNWKWWKFWKPRLVDSGQPAVFTVITGDK